MRYYVFEKQSGRLLFKGQSISIALHIVRMYERMEIETSIGYELLSEVQA